MEGGEFAVAWKAALSKGTTKTVKVTQFMEKWWLLHLPVTHVISHLHE